ncbi:hypothetical protein [Dyadobacter sp. CY343]|uniref:hypothetical protein n=1 Tax=Dyadobacter sp. CY343 TaxID=2907299 RepID=UPI001F48D66F|nr:hypothetical protein [Dyadobacter sp. CY343]MCE7062309.1 hypothetical protein [Dyadobacter sp. CY343]
MAYCFFKKELSRSIKAFPFMLGGTFDEAANELVIGDTESADSEDLLDEALIKTIQMGGEVYLLDQERMPAETAVAAVFRY